MTEGTGSRIKCGMTGGDGSPIRSASLSVEDDGRGWIPHQVRDDKKECGSPIRSASLSVEDDKGCVIPAKAGIQIQLDPQSEALYPV